MPFINEFVRPEDCVVGKKFTGHSSKLPRCIEAESKVDLDSKARCCIDKPADENNIIKIMAGLANRHLIPHKHHGDYINGSQIYVKSAFIEGRIKRETDPLTKSGHRIHICEICCKNLFAVGLIASKAFMNQKISYDHLAKINETIKLIE